MIQSYSGQSLGIFWHTTERLAKVQRVARELGSLSRNGAEEDLQRLYEEESHPLVKADYLYVLEDFENLVRWSKNIGQEFRSKALRLKVLEEISMSIMSAETPLKYSHLLDRIAEARDVLGGQEHLIQKTDKKKTRKMARKMYKEIKLGFKTDGDQTMYDLMQRQRGLLDQVVNTTEYMQEQRRAKGIHDTLYHLDDPQSHKDFLNHLADHKVQDIVSMFRDHYESAGPHIHLTHEPSLTSQMQQLALWGVQHHQPMAVQLCEKYHTMVNLPLPAELTLQLDQYYRFRVLDKGTQEKLNTAYSVMGSLDRAFLYREAGDQSLRSIFNPLEEGFLNKMRM